MRTMDLLGLVKGVPESSENLELIFTFVNLTGLKFSITGDFKFLMPLVWLAWVQFCPSLLLM